MFEFHVKFILPMFDTILDIFLIPQMALNEITMIFVTCVTPSTIDGDREMVLLAF